MLLLSAKAESASRKFASQRTVSRRTVPWLVLPRGTQCGGGPQSFIASGRPVKIPTSAET